MDMTVLVALCAVPEALTHRKRYRYHAWYSVTHLSPEPPERPSCASRRPSMPQQPAPEILAMAPPSGIKPFGLVTQQPSPATPAGAAGLTIGDALISFGDARHLREVQSVLTSSIGKAVPVLCVDSAGRYCRKYVVPAVWDPSVPKSLLGCQMSNQCPADHPAITWRPPRRANGSHHGGRSSRAVPGAPATALVPVQARRSTCWARCGLVLVSVLQLTMVPAPCCPPRSRSCSRSRSRSPSS